MRALILTNALSALTEKDGTTTQQTVTVIVESVLASLKSPSPEVLYAVAAAVHEETGRVIAYEQAERIIRAVMEAAERN